MERKAHCVHCRTSVAVPDSYADGDHIRCGACDTAHRVYRTNEILRLVIADVAPLRDALHANEAHIRNLEIELAAAQASWGIGVNGILMGLLYVVVQIVHEQRALDRGLIVNAVLISLGVGILLEVANFLFLQKRKAIVRLTEDITQLRAEGKEILRKIRESTVRR
jgi:hypothetical protein